MTSRDLIFDIRSKTFIERLEMSRRDNFSISGPTCLFLAVFAVANLCGCGMSGDSSEMRVKDAGYTVDMLAEETIQRLKTAASTGETTKVRQASEDASRGADPSTVAGRKDPNAVSTIVEDTVAKLGALRAGEPAPKEAGAAIEMKIKASSDVSDSIKTRFMTELHSSVETTFQDK